MVFDLWFFGYRQAALARHDYARRRAKADAGLPNGWRVPIDHDANRVLGMRCYLIDNFTKRMIIANQASVDGYARQRANRWLTIQEYPESF